MYSRVAKLHFALLHSCCLDTHSNYFILLVFVYILVFYISKYLVSKYCCSKSYIVFKLFSNRYHYLFYFFKCLAIACFWFHFSHRLICLYVLLKLYFQILKLNQPIGRVVTRSSLEREVRGSYLGSVKSDIVLPTARHRCYISSKGVVLATRNDAETDPANSLHA